MPRLVNRLPKYRKHKVSGQAVVTLNGRDHYLGPHGTKASRREYDRLCGEYLASGGAIIHDKRDEMTIVELLLAFAAHAKVYYAGSSETANYATVIRRLRKSYGSTLVRDFGPLRLKAFRDLLIAEELSRTTVNHATNRVRRILKWGVENELVRPDVLEALKCVAGLRYGKSKAKETEPVRPVADAVVNATLPYCSPQVRAMIELQRLAGMRSGEVCQIRTGDINTQGNVWTYSPARHKTMYRGHARIVYLGPKSQALLRPWPIYRDPIDRKLPDPASGTDTDWCPATPAARKLWRCFESMQKLRFVLQCRASVDSQDSIRRLLIQFVVPLYDFFICVRDLGRVINGDDQAKSGLKDGEQAYVVELMKRYDSLTGHCWFQDPTPQIG
jgi:integrase